MKIGDKYYLVDIESGVESEVTKEIHDAYLTLWNSCKPRIANVGGKIIIFGTGGNIDKEGFDLLKTFYTPNNYGYRKF